MRKSLLIIITCLWCCFIPALAQPSQRNIDAADKWFADAYRQYPGIPNGLLEATAYAASRMVNLSPHNGDDHHNCTGMPERYGLFGLVEDGKGYFRNNLLDVCRLSNITAAQFKQDPALQVLAVARYLKQQAGNARLTPTAPVEAYAAVLEQLSELPADQSSIARYTRSLYSYDIYHFLQTGFETPAVKRKPASIQWQRIYPQETLQLLQSPGIKVDYDQDRIAAPGVPATPTVNNGVSGAPAARSAEYPPAIFDPANTANYQVGRGGSRPTNVTVHTTQGSYAGTISWFKNPASSVSAHYVVRSSDGQVTQMVSENNTAWHVRSNNNYTIGIEHEGFVADGPRWYTDAMYRSSAALVRDICDSWGIDKSTCFRGPATTGVNFLPITVRIKGHQHYSGNTHTDPGVHWNWNKYADLIKPTAIIIANGTNQQWTLNAATTTNARVAPATSDDKAILHLTPNPVPEGTAAQLRYQLPAAKTTAGAQGTLTVADQQGRFLHRQTVLLQPGTNNLSIPTNGWTPGIYYISLRNHANNKTERIRLVIVR